MNKLRKDLIKIAAGNIMLTMAYSFLTVPNKIVNGGVTSCSLVISNALSVDIALIANIFTIVLLALSYFKLGKENFLKTLVGSVFYMVFISLFSAADFGIQMNPLLCVTIASVFVGFGYFLCLNANASVAGFDVIALIINKRFPKIKVATTLRCISIIVLLMGYASFGHQAVIYGIIFSILETQVINVLMWMAQRVEEEKLVFVNIFADELNSRFIDKREYFY